MIKTDFEGTIGHDMLSPRIPKHERFFHHNENRHTYLAIRCAPPTLLSTLDFDMEEVSVSGLKSFGHSDYDRHQAREQRLKELE